MPVELKKIPEELTYPAPPCLVRWLIIIALIVIAGLMLFLYLWPEGSSTSSLWFWFCIIGLPFAAGLSSYALRLTVYENECSRVNHWNRLCHQQHTILIERGQRTAGLIAKAFITPIASNKLASALLNYGSQLCSQYYPYLQRTMVTAQLDPSTQSTSKEKYSIKLRHYATKLIHMLASDLSLLSGANFSIRLRHDGSLDNVEIAQIWQDIFPAEYTVKEFIVENTGDGIMWLDPWLDCDDAALMLCVEFNLFMEPRNYQSESLSAILLASSAWLKQSETKPDALIYRPVISTEDVDSLKDALRWGKLSSDESYIQWRAQVDKDALRQSIQQYESLGYSAGQEESYNLDDLFGSAGAAVGNITLLCACEYAGASRKPQCVMISDKTTHQFIVRQSGG